MKIMIRYLSVLLFTIILLNCSESNEPGSMNDSFSFYYLSDPKLSYWQVKEIPLELIKLQEKPFLTLENVISYKWKEHLFTVSDEAAKNIKVNGVAFVLVVNNRRYLLGQLQDYLLDRWNPAYFIMPAGKSQYGIMSEVTENYARIKKDSEYYNILKKSNKLIE